jgi:hypothetical protein
LFWRLNDKQFTQNQGFIPPEVRQLIVDKKTGKMLFLLEPIPGGSKECWQLALAFHFGGGLRVVITGVGCTDPPVSTKSQRMVVRPGMLVSYSAQLGSR